MRFAVLAIVLALATACAMATPQIQPTWTYPLTGSWSGGRVAANDYAAYFVADWDNIHQCNMIYAVKLADGQLLWSSCLPLDHYWSNLVPPSVNHDYVAVGGHLGSGLCLLNAHTGAHLWDVNIGTNSSNIIVAGPHVLENGIGVLISTSNFTALVGIHDGQPLWTSPVHFHALIDSGNLAYTYANVFVEAYVNKVPSVVAINITDGTTSWSAPLPMGPDDRRLFPRDQYCHGPTLTLSVVYDSTLAGFSIHEKGKLLYNVSLEGSTVFYSTYLSFAKGRLVTQTLAPGGPGYGDFNVAAINGSTGKQLWSAGPYLGWQVNNSAAIGIMPAVSERTVIFADLNAVHALDAATGKKKWECTPYFSAPAAQIFTTTPDGKFALAVYSPIENAFVLAAFPL